MYQRHFTEVLSVSAQQWQSHEVVATEREHTLTRSQQFFCMSLQTFAHVTRITEGVNQVAAVNNVQTFAHVEVPREAVAFPCQIGRHLTDCRRAMTTTCTARCCRIKRNASDNPIGIAVVWHEIQRKT
ncbi:hypothetical protein D3C75_848300 [compost metagenome]